MTFAPIPLSTHFGTYPIEEYVGPGYCCAVTSIALPNQTSYTFQYENNSYGGLTHVGLPTGASTDYTWATLPGAGYRTHRYVTSRTVTVGVQTSQWIFSKQCVDPDCYTVETEFKIRSATTQCTVTPKEG